MSSDLPRPSSGDGGTVDSLPLEPLCYDADGVASVLSESSQRRDRPAGSSLSSSNPPDASANQQRDYPSDVAVQVSLQSKESYGRSASGREVSVGAEQVRGRAAFLTDPAGGQNSTGRGDGGGRSDALPESGRRRGNILQQVAPPNLTDFDNEDDDDDNGDGDDNGGTIVGELAPGEEGAFRDDANPAAQTVGITEANWSLRSTILASIRHSRQRTPVVVDGVVISKNSTQRCGGRDRLVLAAVAVVISVVAVLLAVLLTLPRESSNAGAGNDFSNGADDESLPGTDMHEALSSPQSSALRWLMEEDELAKEAEALLASPDEATHPLFQRYGLAVLYFATGGPNWTNQYSFLSEKHECEWRVGERGIFCDNYKKVEVIRLDKNNMIGSIPLAELAAFPFLSFLNLANNTIGGSLASNIGESQSLDYLNLYGNNLTSTIPASITTLSTLRFIDFGNNKLTGPIPSTIGNLSSSLEFIRFSYNQLSSTIPQSWTELSNLKIFHLHSNRLTGTVPVGPSLNPKLEFMSMGHNLLNGTIPSLFGSFPSLKHIVMIKNSFSGTIPPELFASTMLRHVILGYNMLTGALPSVIGNSDGMEILGVEMNEITGVIPAAYGNLTSALVLSLHSNRLTGEIPSSIGDNNLNLLFLSLEDNMLNSTIPETLANLTNLNWLSLARNNLNGTLDGVCRVREGSDITITADCEGPEAEVGCDCCTLCCHDSMGSCNRHFSVMEYMLRCRRDGSCSATENDSW